MGCNYYVSHEPPCPTCGHGGDDLHIGKSSAGWCFGLHVIPELGLIDLPQWQEFWRGKKIRDEYDKPITEAEMLSVITNRSRPPRETTPFMYEDWKDFHDQNHSEEGPNNLIRSRVDGSHCVGHGAGTWDLIAGEFS
jgi:hypothetical protein